MMKLAIISLVLGLSTASPAAHSPSYGEKISISRVDGSSLDFYYHKPEHATSYSILLYLQGSSCDSVSKDLSTANVLKKFHRFARISAEKYGVSAKDSSCPLEYLVHNNLAQRTADYRQIFKHLSHADPHWDHKLYIVGVSEGAVIAPQVAAEVPQTVSLSLLAGSGNLSTAEHLLLLKTRGLEEQQLPADQIMEEIDALQDKFQEMRSNPTPDLSWQTPTDTYYYWSSALDYRAFDFLKSLRLPLYIVHGTEDQELSIEPTRAMVKNFNQSGRTQLYYEECEGLNHFWDAQNGENHYEETLEMTVSAMLEGRRLSPCSY